MEVVIFNRTSAHRAKNSNSRSLPWCFIVGEFPEMVVSPCLEFPLLPPLAVAKTYDTWAVPGSPAGGLVLSSVFAECHTVRVREWT